MKSNGCPQRYVLALKQTQDNRLLLAQYCVTTRLGPGTVKQQRSTRTSPAFQYTRPSPSLFLFL